VTVNKERIKLLVDALRSDEFRQGHASLRLDSFDGGKPHHCCLGVATEVALRNGLEIVRPEEDIDEYGWDRNEIVRSYPWKMEHQVMCEPVADWYGLDMSPLLEGEVNGRPRLERAITWNDELGADFATIADMFEATYITDETPAP
jgi:hypothetical protein